MSNARASSHHAIPNRIARTKARMQMAVALLPSAPQLPWQTMTTLLDEIVPPADAPRAEPEIAFGVSVSSDWQSLTWHVVDDRDRLLREIGENMQRAGAPASPLLPLLRASISSKAKRLGCWCRGALTGLTAGWSLPVELALEQLPDILPAHPAANLIQQWARNNGVKACLQVEQSYVGAASQTTVHLPLPGEDLLLQSNNARSLLGELAVPVLPDGLLAIISAHNIANDAITNDAITNETVPSPLRLCVELSNGGAVQTGIEIHAPSLSMLRQLYELASTNSGNPAMTHVELHHDRLTAFQTMLGAANVNSVRFMQGEQDFRLLYNFFPLEDNL